MCTGTSSGSSADPSGTCRMGIEKRRNDRWRLCLNGVDVFKNASPGIDELSRAFSAVGHPHRLALVERLIDQAMKCDAPSEETCPLDPPCCDFGELAEESRVGKPTVSHHLKVLRQAALIDREQDTCRVHCRMDGDRFAQLRSFLDLEQSPNTETAS